MDDVKDLLDLCRLNLMEEHIEDSPAPDRDETLAAIDNKRRRIVARMVPSPIAPDAMERHRAENTAEDGVYPWTESPLHCISTPNDTGESRAIARTLDPIVGNLDGDK